MRPLHLLFGLLAAVHLHA
jgi:hypothetical protein